MSFLWNVAKFALLLLAAGGLLTLCGDPGSVRGQRSRLSLRKRHSAAQTLATVQEHHDILANDMDAGQVTVNTCAFADIKERYTGTREGRPCRQLGGEPT